MEVTVEKFKAFQVREEDGQFKTTILPRDISDLPAWDVLIRVHYSSVNYKDALSASGNKGITRQFPHTPGIDAAGTVISTSSAAFQPGEEVIVIGYDLGMNTAGGFGQYIRVPADWVVKRPQGLDLRESMIIGTAGFTAALCIEKLIANGVNPKSGTVLVTGATGGVGIVAVALLHKLGFQVCASTGKPGSRDLLLGLGASEIIDRKQLGDENPKSMLKEQWAGAIDVVGGETLGNVIKSLRYGGSVACCGLVQSPVFKTTVLPFILRGVNLLGVDSVQLPISVKATLWHKLAKDWKLPNLESLCHEINFDALELTLQQVLKGDACGRFVLNLDS